MDFFEADGAVIAFPPAGGVLVHRGTVGWTFHAAGSVAWDLFHQLVHRNHRAEKLDMAELERRDIAKPAPGLYEAQPPVDWESNFPRELPLDRVPAPLRQKVGREHVVVHVVMAEDGYETAFGDGKALYPAAAFWDMESAQKFLEQRGLEAKTPQSSPDPAKAEWYRYSLKEIRLSIDPARGVLCADWKLGPYEHCALDAVIRLLVP